MGSEEERRGEHGRRWGALLLVVGVVWLVFALAARNPLLPFSFAERSQPLPPQSFQATRVTITGIDDRVELVAGSGREVVVAGTAHGFGWSAGAAEDALRQLQISVTPQGDTLAITVRRPTLAVLGRSPFAELQISIPPGVAVEANLISGTVHAEGLQSDLRLTTVSGDVSAENTAGQLTVRTTSGEVEAREHRGPLDVETMSGEVQADGELEQPRVATVSGDVDLSGARGSVQARSISGDIALREAQGANLQLESTSGDLAFEGALADGVASTIANISGDVSVELAGPADLRLDVTTVSGELHSDLRLSDLSQDRRSLRGSVGAGATALTINTTSGSVEVSGR